MRPTLRVLLAEPVGWRYPWLSATPTQTRTHGTNQSKADVSERERRTLFSSHQTPSAIVAYTLFDTEDDEQIVERVASIDVAKVSGMVCTRVPPPLSRDASDEGVGRASDHERDHGPR